LSINLLIMFLLSNKLWKMSNKTCDCGEKEYQYFLKNKQGPSIVKCNSCGLLRTNPSPENTISEPVDFENRLNNLDLWKSFAYKIVLLIKKYKKNNNIRVLDIGSNIGIFVDLARKEGWNAIGIDIDERAITTGKKQFNIDLRLTSLENANFKKEELDVVVLIHTLEHILNLRSLLLNIKRILKKDGLLIIQVPNTDGLPVKIQNFRGKLWYGYDFSHHLWHFQPKTLKNLLLDSGFTIVELDIYSPLFYERTGIISDLIRNIILKISSFFRMADQITLVATPKK